MVGDRGLLTSARIEETLRPAGLDWITALRAPAIKALAAKGGPLQPSLFDTRDMAEIDSPDYPGERLVVCKNPVLGQERARKRSELLAATERELIRIQARVHRASKPLHGAAAIGQAVGAVLGRRKMAKHFQISIGDDAFGFTRDTVAIAAEAALDGIYVVRTDLPAAQSDAAATVRAYKNLSSVERAFRAMKTVDLQLRPVFHWTAPRVGAHANAVGSVAKFEAGLGSGMIVLGRTGIGAAMGQGRWFKGRQFTTEVILWAVRWYLMFPISYRDLELMLLYQPAYVVTALAHSRAPIEAMRSGMAMSLFHASQQASTMSS